MEFFGKLKNICEIYDNKFLKLKEITYICKNKHLSDENLLIYCIFLNL